MISVVIRARNECEWLNRTLNALSMQKFAIDEVILVDNESTDDTLKIADKYEVRVLTISRDDFTFGRALNLGIESAKNEIIAIISAHCIPVNELWADYISVHFLKGEDYSLCGVYGRQEPLPDTSPEDVRDLWTTFREERQVQFKDYFFHNANSAIRKSLWMNAPFDENINGVEDRAWARRMLDSGYKIIYEPNARVYHYHGIHHGRNEGRARRVAQAIRQVREG